VVSQRDGVAPSTPVEVRMNAVRLLSACVLSALLLAACGGSDPDVPGTHPPAGAPTTKGNFTSIVSFGDSLSDVGTYAPATSIAGTGQPPFFGGKFTTNETSTGAPDANPLGKVWVEDLAATLGLVVTPAEVGFNGTSVQCPIAAAAPSLATTCTAYGQGGSRVTDPVGIGHNADGSGALTVPVVQQIANHLARFSSFKDTDLILVYAGNNDVFTQFSAFAAKAAQIQSDPSLSSDQMNLQLFAAQQAAEGAMKQAALELASAVRTEILAKGGKYVAVMTLSDIAQTPFGATLPATARPVLTDLSEVFNLWLREGLAGQPVQIIDTFALFQELATNAAALGFVNTTTPACDATKISAITGGAVTDGSSLFCNATPGAPYNGLVAGADVNTWFFADSVHPTTGAHKAIADAFLAQLQSFGWI
jgi:phospholipase/lecithinase/hemolysin